MRASVLLVAGAALATASPTTAQAYGSIEPQCTDFLIPVKAKASNRLVFSPTLDLTTIGGVTSFLGSTVGLLGSLLGFIPQHGTYDISARYCAPAARPTDAPASRNQTLQVLLHGIPYDKNYWNGLYFPKDGERYSWVKYANAQGYPTLQIDNLGSGNSSKPDPILVVQQNLETEILHEIFQMARAGQIEHAPKAGKVIFVGHSIGAVTGNGVATRYPESAFDAGILTGYTYTVAQSAIGLLTDLIVPASLQNKARFSGLPPAYLTFASVEGKRNTYYGDEFTFDPDLPAWDVEKTQGTLTLGELLSILTGLQKAPKFKGDIFVVTGRQDALFCSLGSRALVDPDCGEGQNGLVAKSQEFWPQANYDFALVNGGHSVTLHYSAQEQFKLSHDFLAKSGY